MTNEQIAEFIQNGGADDLKPVLYDRVKHLMYKLMTEHYNKYTERFIACGYELCDLRAECYPAFLKALESFKPAKKFKFVTYLDLHIKNTVNDLLGIRNKDKLNHKPLDNCNSLDMPLSSEDDNFTLGDTIVDETSEQAFENAIQSIRDEKVKQVLHKAIASLDEPLRDVIVLYYFENMTQEEIGRRLGVSGEGIRQRKAKALRQLRRNADVRLLREEQHIERRLHFTARDNNEAYYIAQRKIAEIERRGDYLSYGKRQAIIFDCRVQQAIEDNAEYQALTEFEELMQRVEQFRKESVLQNS